jgi:hypothetical protein
MEPLDRNDQSPYSLLSRFSKASEHIDLISSFQGISFSQSVLIQTLGDRQVDVHVDRHPNWVKNDQVVFLTHPSFTRPIGGHVARIDWNKSLLTLAGFNQCDHCWQDRHFERVQPGAPARVQIFAAHQLASGGMANISTTGMGILVYNPQKKPMVLNLGSDVTLKCILPFSNVPLILKGTIARQTVQSNPNFTQFGFSIHPTQKQTHILKEYIQARKENILRELELTTRKAFEPMETKDLYF